MRSFTVEQLRPDHYQVLQQIRSNPRTHVQPQRLALFKRLRLVVATEPPRPPRTHGRKPPAERAHALTKRGMAALDGWELEQSVTTAIVRAQGLPPGSDDAIAAYQEVSRLEEAIAARTPPDDLKGQIARVGAATAALSAGDPMRALELANRYLTELSEVITAPDVAAKLRQLAHKAAAVDGCPCCSAPDRAVSHGT